MSENHYKVPSEYKHENEPDDKKYMKTEGDYTVNKSISNLETKAHLDRSKQTTKKGKRKRAAK